MKNIPFHKPHIGRQAQKMISAILKSGWLTTGARVKEFEEGVLNLLGLKYTAAVSSGTAALHLAYLTLDLKAGDEVIVPSFTFCSTINMIVHTGATPIFCDIDSKTLCIDTTELAKKITDKTKAVVVVHFAGMPADLDKIGSICAERGIPIIEDAAHAFLTEYKGKYIGAHGNTTCFSFYVTKTITTAEGGMVATASSDIIERVYRLSLHGLSRGAEKRYNIGGSWKYSVLEPGYKYNLSDVHATIGLSQLPNVLRDKKERTEIANLYRELLKSCKDIELPIDPPYEKSSHVWHLFTILVKDQTKRDVLIEWLKERGVGVSVHFQPNHLQPAYHVADSRLPVTEKIGDSILSLPIYPGLKKGEVKYIVLLIKEFFSK